MIKYGFIVMDEVAIETHGTWQKKYLPKDVDIEYATLPGSNPIYREFTLKRGEGMFERDKNFPCILFLSLGNESHAGKNLEELSSYFKKVDSNRIVHYEGCFHNPRSETRYHRRTSSIHQLFQFHIRQFSY